MNSSAPLARFVQLVALAGLAAGCSTLPHQRPTVPPLPVAWTEANTAGDKSALINWWESFDDPLLDQLITEGLERNPNVRQAAIRVRESRAQAHQTIGYFAPQVSGQARGQYTRAIEGAPLVNSTTLTAESEQATGSYGVTMSWEIPLLSRLINASVGAKANTRSVLADERGAKVSLVADVAQAYVDLRTAQNRRAALREAADIGDQLAKILDISSKAGFASLADAADARRQSESAKAQLPDAEITVRRAENQLAVLRAHAPGTEDPALVTKLDTPQEIPVARISGAPAAPADLIRLRPDIAGAEAQAMVAAAQVGIARDDILPKLTLTGSILASDNLIGALLPLRSQQGSATPLITIPLLDWGTHAAAIRAKKGAFQRSLIVYENTVNQAVSEASIALTQLAQGEERLRQTRAAEADAEVTAKGFRASYGAGIASLTDRLRADQQLLDARLTRIQSESQSAGAAISVFRAFGGGPPPLPKAALTAAKS